MMSLKRVGVFVAVCAVAPALNVRADCAVSVMTFNIRYGTALDGRNSWPHRRELVIDTIKQYEPDLIGTQECLEFQADYIVDHLPAYAWFGVGREVDCGGERMAVLYKKDALAPVETGSFWLSEKPETPGSKSWDTACPRMVTWARFYHRTDKVFFYLFNTHFDHRSGMARQASAELLPARVWSLCKGFPSIITGDFNAAGGNDRPWGTLTQAGFRDAWEATAERVGPAVTNGRFGPPDVQNGSRIDWILFSGRVKCLSCETIVYNRDGRYPSDHYPVFARLMIEE